MFDAMAAPIVSFSDEANAAVTARYSVTVSGLGFGVGATTPTAAVGLSSCATAAWVSTSSVACMLSAGEGTLHDTRVTVSGVVGSRTSAFSYDGVSFCRYGAALLVSYWFTHCDQTDRARPRCLGRMHSLVRLLGYSHCTCLQANGPVLAKHLR